jgi:hypothetical protein
LRAQEEIVSYQPGVECLAEYNDPLSREDRVLGLVDLYSSANQRFAWWDQVPDLDWEGAFKEFLTPVMEAEDPLAYYLLLKKFLSLLNDGHTEVYLPETVEMCTDILPIDFAYYENRYVILDTYPNPEILEKEIPPGTVIEAIEGEPTEEYLEREVFPYLSASTEYQRRMINFTQFPIPTGNRYEFELTYPDGATETRVLTADCYETIDWGTEEESFDPCECEEGYFEAIDLGEGIVHLLYTGCSDAVLADFTAYMEEIAADPPKGIVFDLRGNGGGSLITSATAASYFLSETIPTWARQTRCFISTLEDSAREDWQPEIPFRRKWLDEDFGMTARASQGLPEGYRPGWLSMANPPAETLAPHPASYKGPLVILVDHQTGSAAEDLTVLLRGNNRAPVIGEVTAGTSGFQYFLQLPGEGWARICDVRHTYPRLGDYIGYGIYPDIPVLRTVKGIAEGRDEILEAGLNYLENPGRSKTLGPPPNSRSYAGGLLGLFATD